MVVQFAPVARALMDAAPQLKVIGVVRGGAENVDLATATAREISRAEYTGTQCAGRGGMHAGTDSG